ncbi:MAG: class I SAM-dependent methyltransferase [Rhodospirillales bacterium]|nr:class I SAM-dependent methyltransferase [Rhodospirillales bacterium]
MIEGPIVLGIALAAMAFILYPTIYVGVPPMPSSSKAIQAALDALPRDFEGTIFELGSGWGNLVGRLAAHCPKSQIIGYEISPLPWLVSKIWLQIKCLSNAQIQFGNFTKSPMEEADLVVCFLAPHSMNNLAPLFKQRLRPGALILSNTFALPDWEPLSVTQVDDLYSTSVYLYRV